MIYEKPLHKLPNGSNSRRTARRNRSLPDHSQVSGTGLHVVNEDFEHRATKKLSRAGVCAKVSMNNILEISIPPRNKKKIVITMLLLLTLLPTLLLAQLVKTPADLPADLVWETNNTAPVFASDKAVKGGIFRTMITDFPPTFRQIGPNANSSFRSFLDVNNLSLIDMHPQTDEYIPALATHWAIAADNKTAYFKLNPNARWSDGMPITAADYLFTLEFMRSPHIVAPWYNNHYSKEITNVTQYDDYTISVTLGHAKPREDVLLNASMTPTPKHFHQLDKNWVQWANWKIAPTTGELVGAKPTLLPPSF